jgi:proline iminopeptidase/L-proline amide hydrolase
MDITRRTALGGLAASLAWPVLAKEAPLAPGALLKPDREEMVRVPGGRVYVRINGDLSGPRPPIVLLHGGPGSSHWYSLNATALADERAVILYDQLDSGRSDHPNDARNWHLPRFVAELEAIRSALRIRGWHALGTSWGAMVVLDYASRRPNELASAILSSPAVSAKAWIRDANHLIAAMPRKTRDLLIACGSARHPPQTECDAATDAFYRRHLNRHDPPAAVEAYRRAMPESFNPKIYREMWGPEEFRATGTLKNFDMTRVLTRLNGSRTLFVAGQFDEAVPSTVAAYARKAGATFREVPNAGHLAMNDNPMAYLGILRPWLRSRDPKVI